MNIDELHKKLIEDQDFLDIVAAIRQTTYSQNYNYESTSKSGLCLCINNTETDTDVAASICNLFERNGIIKDSKNSGAIRDIDDAIKMSNQFLMSILTISYLWDLLNTYKLRYKGEILILNTDSWYENLKLKRVNLTISIDSSEANCELYFATMECDCIIRIHNDTSLATKPENYLKKFDFQFWNKTAHKDIIRQLEVNECTVDVFEKYIEQQVELWVK